jgi:hypothetical protein
MLCFVKKALQVAATRTVSLRHKLLELWHQLLFGGRSSLKLNYFVEFQGKDAKGN